MEFDDDYYLNDISDEERGADSSEDDEAAMAVFHKVTRNLAKRRMMTDFEAEMEAERERRATDLQADKGYTLPDHPKEKQEAGKSDDNFYDKVYFDSDSDDDEQSDKRRVLTDMELLYDPDEDSADQAWVDKQRGKYHNQAVSGSKLQPSENSDAVLNCPACFSLLCLDCQRHETYQTQYRAMFVFNCTVDQGKVMRYPNKPVSTTWKKKKTSTAPEEGSEEVYHPVTCNVCSTNVAVYDKDEVYHFFNVMPSH